MLLFKPLMCFICVAYLFWFACVTLTDFSPAFLHLRFVVHELILNWTGKKKIKKILKKTIYCNLRHAICCPPKGNEQSNSKPNGNKSIRYWPIYRPVISARRQSKCLESAWESQGRKAEDYTPRYSHAWWKENQGISVRVNFSPGKLEANVMNADQ